MKKTITQNQTQSTQKSKSFNQNAIKKLYQKKYSKNQIFSNWEPNEKISSMINKYGFLSLLNSGFNSLGDNTLEITIPENYDRLFQHENCFSIFFWLILQKQNNTSIKYIIKKGNLTSEFTPTVGLLQNNTNLFIKLTTSNKKIENLISNKKLEQNKIYSICLSVNFDMNENITEMYLYIDGILDSQNSIPGIPSFNNGNIILGKPNLNTFGFNGIVSEIILCPKFIDENEIIDIYNDCINLFNENQGESFESLNVFESKFQRTILLEKYIKYTGNKPFGVDNVSLSNSELKEIIKKYDNDEILNDEDENNNENNDNIVIDDPKHIKILEKMNIMLSNNDEFLTVKNLYLNAKTIYTVLFLCSDGEDFIEVKRVIDIFEILSENLLFNIDYDFMYRLCNNLSSISNEDKNYFSMSVFFNNLKQIHDIYFPDENITEPIIYDEDSKEPIRQYENLLMSTQGCKNVIDDNNTLDSKSFRISNIKDLYKKKDKSSKNTTQEGFNQIKENDLDNNNNEDKMIINNNFISHDKRLDFEDEKITENENENDYSENIKTDTKEKEKNEYEPEIPKDWEKGNFEIIINHCYNCHEHKMTTRHLEFQFIDKFNEIGEAIKNEFPNCIIYGNFDYLEYFGQFDVYLRGIGPFFDEQGRFFIFKKQQVNKFPKVNEIIDKLIALSIVYGGSINMESAQKQFLKENYGMFKKSIFFHELPASYSEKCIEAMNEFKNGGEKKERKKSGK